MQSKVRAPLGAGFTKGLWIKQALGGGVLQTPEPSLFQRRRPSDYQHSGAIDRDYL